MARCHCSWYNFKRGSRRSCSWPFWFSSFFQLSLGIISKKDHKSFRLIHHLSFPDGMSLNDNIGPSLCTVSYASFDNALDKICNIGKGALLSKADIKSAFRLLPTKAFNCLGFNGGFYYDKCLPLCCSLSCCYFETFSTFLEWVVSFKTGLSNLII